MLCMHRSLIGSPDTRPRWSQVGSVACGEMFGRATKVAVTQPDVDSIWLEIATSVTLCWVVPMLILLRMARGAPKARSRRRLFVGGNWK